MCKTKFALSSADDAGRSGNRLVQLCLVGLMASLVAVACCVPPPRNTLQERLDELGVDEQTYRAMPVEQQIEIFVEMERYFAHNSTVRMWMEDAIIEKGQEAVGPVVETIRGLANQEHISTSEELAIRDLMLVLGWIHLDNRANLKGTVAQTLVEEMAASSKINKFVRLEARRSLYMILCDKDPPIYPEEPDLTCPE